MLSTPRKPQRSLTWPPAARRGAQGLLTNTKKTKKSSTFEKLLGNKKKKVHTFVRRAPSVRRVRTFLCVFLGVFLGVYTFRGTYATCLFLRSKYTIYLRACVCVSVCVFVRVCVLYVVVYICMYVRACIHAYVYHVVERERQTERATESE
jgi:hypothetical protein